MPTTNYIYTIKLKGHGTATQKFDTIEQAEAVYNQMEQQLAGDKEFICIDGIGNVKRGRVRREEISSFGFFEQTFPTEDELRKEQLAYTGAGYNLLDGPNILNSY